MIRRAEARRKASGGYPVWRENRIGGAYIDLGQGSLRQTNSSRHLAIQGPGFFNVRTPQGDLYTRNGEFSVNRDGLLLYYDRRVSDFLRIEDTSQVQFARTVYRVAQEALRNVAKHSGASRARVTLRRDAGALVLTVADLGKGFDTSCLSTRQGLGLASMDERARLVQAEFTAESRLGKGTTIRVRAPLP